MDTNVMDTNVTTLTATPAMATVIIEPENLSRMMISFCLAVPATMGSPIKTQTFAHGSVF
jgi:hypothetical protein